MSQGFTKGVPIDTDVTLSANSNLLVPSQYAVRTYVTSELATNAVTSARIIATTAPLTGGGDLSANRTIAIPQATASVNGYLISTDWTIFNNKIGGSGTASYVPRFSASGTIGNGVIQDNGTNVGVNIAPSTSYKLQVSAPSTISPQVAIRGISASIGVDGYASIDDGTVIGVQGYSTDDGNPFVSLICIGGKFTGFGGGTNYSVQLQDGTEAVNKVLLSATADGKANWSSLKTVNSNSLIGSGNISVVSSVTGTSPIVSSGGATPAISMPAATSSVDGYLSSADYTAFINGLDDRKTGNFYRKSQRWYVPSDNSNTLSTTNHSAPSVFLVPFPVQATMVIDQLAIEITTPGAAGSFCRFGIYRGNPTSVNPSTLLVDSGDLSSATIGNKTFTPGTPLTLTPGLYFTAFSTNSASAFGVRSLITTNFAQVIGLVSPGNVNLGTYINGVRATYGALPSMLHH